MILNRVGIEGRRIPRDVGVAEDSSLLDPDAMVK